MQDEQTVPNMDHGVDGANQGQAEADLLDSILRQSEFTADLYEESIPPEEVPEVDPTESEEESVEEPEAEDEVDEEYEETEEVVESDEDGAEAPTQDTEVYTAEDLDLDAKVRVKIDGEEMDVSFDDLLKGYTTDSSLSKKGRELGEQRKAFEAEVEQAKAQLSQLGEASLAVLQGDETQFSQAYHKADADYKKAVEAGETWELDDLKEKREIAQKGYWEARTKREGIAKSLEEQRAAENQKKLQAFSEKIVEYIPEFNEEVAVDLREFALNEGVSEEVLNTVTDPAVVKLLWELKEYKAASSKGAEKRKAAPAKKTLPTKKAKSQDKKKQDQESMLKARAFKDNASKADQDAYAKLLASKSLGNLN